MVLFSVLLVALLVISIVAALVVLTSGAGLILAFGDLIVCGLILWAIVKLFKRKKK